MGISERKHHIKVLKRLLKETKGKIELYSDNKNIDLRKEKEIVEALGYAIPSLNLMYEREEIYTKADMMAMLTEIQLEIEEIVKEEEIIDSKWASGLHYSEKIIQQKINALKGE